MVFSSITFLYGFLPLVLLLWWTVPKALRNWVLLASSILFYAFGQPVFVLLLLFSAISSWAYGRMVEQLRGTRSAKLVLLLSIAVNLLLLSFFKYADFLIASINQITGANIPLLNIPLPIGISFFLFQSMSYVIDVYRGSVPAQKNLASFSTYLCFFPQLIAGPVVRYEEVHEGLEARKSSLAQLSMGIRRFTFGLAKKVLLANTLDELCSTFRASTEQSVLFVWIYAIAFTLQIYFDFSGYSDMAIGMGQMFGFRFPENFRYPYVSRSITEFWRRWHITLGSWFRDYVYIPLGGNRSESRSKWFRNLAVVWLLTGLWHGAAWNFVLWGGMYGLLIMLEKLWLGRYLAKYRLLSHGYVLLVTLVGFVIFHADGLVGMQQDLSALFGFSDLPLCTKETIYYLKSYGLVLIMGVVGATPMAKKLGEKGEGLSVMTVLEPLTVGALLLAVTAYLVDGSFNPFLYFRF